jgi:hypothetical protein
MHQFITAGRIKFAAATNKAAAGTNTRAVVMGSIVNVPWSMFSQSVPICDGGFMQRGCVAEPDPYLLQSLREQGYQASMAQLAVCEVPISTEEMEVLMKAGLYPPNSTYPVPLAQRWEEGRHKEGGMTVSYEEDNCVDRRFSIIDGANRSPPPPHPPLLMRLKVTINTIIINNTHTQVHMY